MTNRDFDHFPTLTTDRLMLRQLSMDDQHSIFTLRSDKEINKYLDRRVASTIEEAAEFIRKINANIHENNSAYWAITLTRTNTFVGTICLFNFSNGKNSCEIGYELMTEFQGQGFMKEAAEKVIEYAFQTLAFQKIIAVTHNGNQASTKLLSNLKFIPSVEKDIEQPEVSIFTLTHSN
jgi:[ribosomal protein S5]-alanine N-acetyltransferase